MKSGFQVERKWNMNTLDVREEILKCHDYAIENEMTNQVIRLYINGEDDIEIWEDKGYFYFSTGSFRYGKLDELIDDLCEEIEDNKYEITNIEIE